MVHSGVDIIPSNQHRLLFIAGYVEENFDSKVLYDKLLVNVMQGSVFLLPFYVLEFSVRPCLCSLSMPVLLISALQGKSHNIMVHCFECRASKYPVHRQASVLSLLSPSSEKTHSKLKASFLKTRVVSLCFS